MVNAVCGMQYIAILVLVLLAEIALIIFISLFPGMVRLLNLTHSDHTTELCQMRTFSSTFIYPDYTPDYT